MTQLAVLDYWGINVIDLTGTKGDCFQPRDIGPDGGQVAAFVDGKIHVCGGSMTQQCFAYDKMNDRWITDEFALLHGDYGMCDSAAGVVMNENSWLVTGGDVTYPYRYALNTGSL